MRLTLLLLAACTGPTSSDTGTSEQDSGSVDTDTAPVDDADDPEHAVPLTFDGEGETDTLHDDDVDWYSIVGAAGQQFRIQVTNTDEDVADDSLDTVVSVFDESLTRIAWENEHPMGDVSTYDSVCFGFFPAAGTYFIKVEDQGTFEGVPRPVDSTQYTIEALSPSSVPTEPDTVQSVGKQFNLDTDDSWYAIPVFSESSGDVDYVKLQLPHADGALIFGSAEHIESSPYTPAIQAYNAEADLVLQAATALPADGRSLPSPQGDAYVLAVTDSSGGGGGGDGMWMFVRDAAEGYGNQREHEPNDADSPEALALEDQEPDAGFWFADYREGRLGSPSDDDAFRFTTTEDAYITIAFGALAYGSLLEAEVSITDPGGTVVATSTASAGTDPDTATSTKVAPGDYTVHVRGTGNTTYGEGAFYRLAVHETSNQL